MKKTLFIALVITLGIFSFSPGAAFSSSYFIYDLYGGTWSDTDKTIANAEDDLMCWAAATSNILAYTGWGLADGMTTADDIFQYFQVHWTNEGGHPFYAIDWWFDGENDSQKISGWSQVDVKGGGFYPGLDCDNFTLYIASTYWAMDYLDYLLTFGYASIAGISNGYSQHAITIWGLKYEYDPINNPYYYLGLYMTDSDDNIKSLKYYDVAWDTINSRWNIMNYSEDEEYYIHDVFGLMIMNTTIPEPTSMLLFEIGLLSIIGFIRNKKFTFT